MYDYNSVDLFKRCISVNPLECAKVYSVRRIMNLIHPTLYHYWLRSYLIYNRGSYIFRLFMDNLLFFNRTVVKCTEEKY